MSKLTIAQNTFSSGEWAPSLYARTDLAKYVSACKLLKNWLLHPHGGASTRPGSYHVAATKTGTKQSVLLPFQFSVTQNYVLEFGDYYMRVIKDYDYVYESGSISGVTKANPGVVTCTAHPFIAGDVIYITGVVGMTELNGNYYKVGESPGTNDFHLHTLGDVHVDTTTYGTYVSGGTVTSPYEIVTPYAEADLYRLKVGPTQNADTMFLTHPSYALRTLTRTGDAAWTLASVTIGATQAAPTVPTSSATLNISDITKANPGVVTTVQPHGLADDDIITITEVVGMVEVNNRMFAVDVQSSTTFDLHDIDTLGSVNTTGYTTYSSGGLVRPLSNGYVITAVSGDAEESLPTAVCYAKHGQTIHWAGASGASFYRVYCDTNNATSVYGFVADVMAKGNEGVAKTITDVTQATPGVVTAAGHGFVEGDFIHIASVVGMTELNGNVYRVGPSPTTNTFALYNAVTNTALNTSAYGAYVSGGTATKCIGWLAQNITPDLEAQPPIAYDPFSGAGNYPGCATFFDQRLVAARPNNAPDTVYGSQIGRYKNFNVSHEIRDDDSWEHPLNSRKMNEIIWLLPLDSLLIGTSGEEWQMTAGTQSDTITQTSVKAKKQSEHGSATMPPVVVGNVVLFLQYGARVIREMTYSLEQDAYIGRDLTIMATHLFRDYTIIDWCYQRNPDSTVWCVRDDGVLLGLTYLREQEVWGWHRHITDGLYESVCTIPDGVGNDRLYVVVQRTINGSTVRHIECFAERDVTEIKNVWCVDDGMSYGWGATECHSISGITKADPCVVTTATAHGFSEGDYVDIDDVVGMTEVNTHRYRVGASPTTYTIHLQSEEGNEDIDSTGYTAYVSGGYIRKCATVLSGLEHLEGEDVAVLANGGVVPSLVVSSGQITLPARASRVIVGKGFTCDLKTLDLVAQGQYQTTIDRKRRIVSVQVALENTRSLWVGPDEESLIEIQFRTNEAWGDPTRLFTGNKVESLAAGESDQSSVCMRVSDPVPATVLSLAARLEAGGEA